MRTCKPSLAVLSLIGFISMPAIADVPATATNNQAEIKKISSETRMLRSQMMYLQREIKSLKKQQIGSTETDTTTEISGTKKHNHVDANTMQANHIDSTGAYTDTTKPLSQSELNKFINEEREYLPFDLDVPGQAFVSTGPYVGVPIQYAGGNLVINSPSVNTDLQLLAIRKSIREQLMAMGGMIPKEPYHSHLLLSGLIEAQANYTNIGGAPSTSNIDVTSASLDAFMLGPSDWILGFMEFSYDNSRPSGSFYTVSNSRVYINKAFVTLGNLHTSPYYGTVGKYYVPFGTYSSIFVTDPFTKVMMRTKANAITVGVKEPGDNSFLGSVYIFRGDSHAASVSKINNGGVNVAYNYKTGIFHGNVGGGVIANIADSAGFQSGNGFSQYEQIVHRVPGYDMRGIFSFGEHIDFIGEYLTASTAFNPNDMSFNGGGAKPWAFDSELAYTFTMMDNKPSTIGLGYQKSGDALSLGLPTSRYSIVFNTSLWRNTLESLEFRRDLNYAASDTGNGPTGAATTPGQCTSFTCTASGKYDNAVTAQFDYFF